MNFDWQPVTRLIFGSGVLERLGEEARSLGSRALLVSDPGIVAVGYVSRAQSLLEQAGVLCAVFAEVQENPTTVDVTACVAAARAAGADLLVALGGGSAMDTAKGANFVLTNGGRMQDYWGVGKAAHPLLPLIAIPTTAGTGSEVQSFALIADADTHQKMACGDLKATPRLALLDPDLTLSLPRRVTADSGLDALSHAVETAVTRRRTPLSWLFSREAFRLLAPALPRVLEAPADREARASLLLGAAYAGLAIENSMLGAAHSLANPLTARYSLRHGQAVASVLPQVVRFNAQDPDARQSYTDLMAYAGLDATVEALVAHLLACRSAAEFPSLAAQGVSLDAVEALAEEASRQWTAQFNPRRVGASEFEELYRAALTSPDGM